MYAIPYTPETTRQEIMSSFGVMGIPSLIVMNSKGKVITTSGRSAVEGNAAGCVEEWKEGKPGIHWISALNWGSILFYVALAMFWWWWRRSEKVVSKLAPEELRYHG
jgi:hypothetical protein